MRNVYSYVFFQICEVRNALEAETLGLSSNIAETNSAAGSSKGQDRDREGGCGLLFQSAGQSHLTLHPVTAIMPPMIVTIRRGAWLKETKPNYVPRSPEYEEESLIAKEHEQRQRQQQQLGDASEVHRSATRNGAWEKRLNPTTAKQSPHDEPTISPATLYPVHSSCILVVSSSQVNKQLAPTGTPSRRRLFLPMLPKLVKELAKARGQQRHQMFSGLPPTTPVDTSSGRQRLKTLGHPRTTVGQPA